MTRIKKLLKKNFAHFAYFYRHLRYRIFVTMILSFVVGVLDGFGLTMFIPLLQMVNGKDVASDSDLGGMSFIVKGFNALGINMTLLSVILIIILFFIAKGVASFANTYYNVIIRLYFIRKLRFDNIDNFGTYRFKSFVVADAGMIQNTMSGEVGRVSQAYGAYFSTIQSWILLLVYVSLAFITNWQFAVLVALGGGLSNFAYKQIYKRTKYHSLQISTGGHTFQRLLIQMVSFFKYLKATGYMVEFGKKLKESVVYIENANKKIGYYNAILSASREPLTIIVVMVVIAIQINFLTATMGEVVLSLLFFYRALIYIMAVQSGWNSFLNTSGAITNMNSFMDDLTHGKEKYGTIEFGHFENSVSLKEVAFKYGNTLILKNINLGIAKNKTVAFVGESGSGKTTLVNLVSGLMPVDGGQITVDGINYTDLDLRTLQKKIGYITQDPVVFSDTVFNNITLWAPKTPENLDRFWRALEQAAIAQFIRGLEKKEDNLLGNNGIQVSGGQKQRLSIARELYKEVEILVMDEATSALDSETEKSIQENIQRLKGKYTILIVAHRLSTIKEADEIFLMDKGEILASGTFDQLVKESKYFRRMTEMQVI